MTLPDMDKDLSTYTEKVRSLFAAAGRDRQAVVKVWNDNFDGKKLEQWQADIVADAYRDALRQCGALVA